MSEVKEKRTLMYYDSRTGLDLEVIHSVEITDQCPNRKGTDRKVILDFAQATEGILVNLTDCYPKQDLGGGVMNFVRSLDDLKSDTMGSFCFFAEVFGLTPAELVKIILQEAPTINRTKLISDFRVFKEKDGIKPSPYFTRLLRESGLTMADIQ